MILLVLKCLRTHSYVYTRELDRTLTNKRTK